MRYSQMFGKTSKSAPADAESTNARLLTQGGFVVKQMAGVYNYLPLGLRVLSKIQNIIRTELNAEGAQEILMPALTAEENYVTTGRENLDILFHLEGAGGSKMVLNQSHEEVVTPLVKLFTLSYRDLPMAVYQIQNKFRNEPRAKSGVLRGREFNMKDLYSFHATEDDLNAYYEKMKAVYFRIYERLGFSDRVVLAYASGGSFSRYSHEFQALADVGEDTVHLCEKCRVGVNKEIISEQTSCPNCGNVDLVERRAIEVGNIFKLRTRFTDSFGFRFKNASDTAEPVEMGCYGIGPSRIMGTLVEMYSDDRGIVWPKAVAPYQVHLVSLATSPDEAVAEAAERLYKEMLAAGVEVLFDDRFTLRAGEKFADADLIGIPTRLVISKKTLEQQSVEVKPRSSSDASLIPLDSVLKHLL